MKVIDINTGEDITPLSLTREQKFAEDIIKLSSSQIPLEEVIEILFKKYNL